MTDDISQPHAPVEDRDGSGREPAPEELHRHATAQISVEWRPGRCIHSGRCVRALPLVFDPRRRPWIEADKASADAIALVVRGCPTGALRYVRHDGASQETPDVPATLTPVLNGPLYIRGDVKIRGLDGNPVRRESRAAICRLTRASSS